MCFLFLNGRSRSEVVEVGAPVVSARAPAVALRSAAGAVGCVCCGIALSGGGACEVPAPESTIDGTHLSINRSHRYSAYRRLPALRRTREDLMAANFEGTDSQLRGGSSNCNCVESALSVCRVSSAGPLSQSVLVSAVPSRPSVG